MIADRLSSLDIAFLSLERPDNPMHLGGAAVFRPARRVSPTRLVDLLTERAARVPRLRQRVRPTWLPVGGAVWANDPGFEPARHIHLHRLPQTAGRGELAGAVAEAMAEPLDLNRPLWEMHLVTGLQDGSFAVLTKLHHAMADGLRAVELGVAMLDEAAAPSGAGAAPADDGAAGPKSGEPGPASPALADTDPADRAAVEPDLADAASADLAPGLRDCGDPASVDAGVARAAAELASRALGSLALRPAQLLLGPARAALSAAGGLPGTARQAGQVLGIAASVLRNATPPAAGAPWIAGGSPDRGLALVRLDLADLNRIRRRHGGTLNDVLLAVVTGALRRWLFGRGGLDGEVRMRALIPVSRAQRQGGAAGGNLLSGYLCPLPVSEADPLVWLQAIRSEMDRNKAAGSQSGPGALPLLADSLPPAVHRLAGPFAGRGAPLLFDTVVTNVPLPSVPLHLAGAELREIYPVVPLAHGHALGVAISTYRGTAHLVLHADRRAVPDLDRLAAAVPAAVGALSRIPHP